MPKGKANKRYTTGFKINVVKTMIKDKLSYRETAKIFLADTARKQCTLAM